LQYLIANASTAESKVFYLKMKGDYYRSVSRNSFTRNLFFLRAGLKVKQVSCKRQ
jgi:hypothetical protein